MLHLCEDELGGSDGGLEKGVGIGGGKRTLALCSHSGAQPDKASGTLIIGFFADPGC